MVKKKKNVEDKLFTKEEVLQVIEKIEDFKPIDSVELPQEPVPPSLTKEELNRLQLTQFKIRAFEAEMQLEMLRRDLFLKQIDPEGRLQKMMSLIRGRTDEAVVAKQEYNNTVKSIEGRLSISLKEWAYNDDNGELTKVDQ